MARGEQKRLSRERKGLQRDLSRRQLAKLRRELADAKKRRRARQDKLRSDVKRARARLSRKTADFRREWREWVNEQVGKMRARAKARWATKTAKAMRAPIAAELKAQRALEAEREFQAAMRRSETWEKVQLRKAPRASKRERRSESDDLVRQNIPPELRPVWEARKSRVKGSAHRSRTEEFLDWASDNPEEVEAILWGPDAQAGLDKELAEAEARYYQQQQATGTDDWVPF